MEVEHVKAHRTKKDKKEVSHFERFVTAEAKRKVEFRGSKEKWNFVDQKERRRSIERSGVLKPTRIDA